MNTAAVGAEILRDRRSIADTREQANYYPWLDWLRLALAVLVMLDHLKVIPALYGIFAVQIFFALSGWLIGGILLDTAPAALPRFYFNRAARIWAPYFLTFSLLLTAGILHDHVKGAEWWLVFAYMATFVYNQFGAWFPNKPLNGTGNHLWSVNAEEQFYLAAPLLLSLAPARVGRSIALWAAIAVAGWWSDAHSVYPSYAAIASGVLAALVSRRFPDLRPGAAGAAVAIAVIACCFVAFGHGYYGWCFAPCAIAIVLLLTARGQKSSIGAFAGGMSYPLYLNAWVAVFVVHGILKRIGSPDGLLEEALVIPLALALSAAQYWWFDRRILASRSRLYTAERARRVMWVAYATIACGVSIRILAR